ncbi:hypothetical protein [Bradyrhizobium elkanii]|uniref:hypothetical protein n=1 Tax=Bradyrhizobium elkanii TaxID=29448 RepID=UPI003D1CC966
MVTVAAPKDITPRWDYVAMRDKILPDSSFEPATKLGDNVVTPNQVTNQTTQQSIVNGGSPGGSDTDVQFNDGGAFGGEATLTFDKANKKLSIGAAGSIGRVAGPAAAAASNADGSSLVVQAGDGDGSGDGGSLGIFAGNGGTTGENGDIEIIAGGNASHAGGDVVIQGGDSAIGGDVILSGGPGSSGPAGRVVIGESYRAGGTLTTTDNAFHSVADVFGTTTNSAGLVRARVVGHRSSGSAGSANDSFMAEIVQGVKNNAGTVSLLSSLTFVFFYGDNAVCDVQFFVNGTQIELQVKGDTNNNYHWTYELWYQSVQ